MRGGRCLIFLQTHFCPFAAFVFFFLSTLLLIAAAKSFPSPGRSSHVAFRFVFFPFSLLAASSNPPNTSSSFSVSTFFCFSPGRFCFTETLEISASRKDPALSESLSESFGAITPKGT